jgi:hypothetical protein
MRLWLGFLCVGSLWILGCYHTKMVFDHYLLSKIYCPACGLYQSHYFHKALELFPQFSQDVNEHFIMKALDLFVNYSKVTIDS